MAVSQALCLYFLIPVSKVWIIVVTPVALLKVTESKHGCHIALPVAVHTWNPYKIIRIVLIITHSSKQKMVEIIIPMYQKAVVYNLLILKWQL